MSASGWFLSLGSVATATTVTIWAARLAIVLMRQAGLLVVCGAETAGVLNQLKSSAAWLPCLVNLALAAMALWSGKPLVALVPLSMTALLLALCWRMSVLDRRQRKMRAELAQLNAEAAHRLNASTKPLRPIPSQNCNCVWCRDARLASCRYPGGIPAPGEYAKAREWAGFAP